MSPVCGAACVIDMLTVNVIGGTEGGTERVRDGRTQTPTAAAAAAVSAFDGSVPCAEVVKPSHSAPCYPLPCPSPPTPPPSRPAPLPPMEATYVAAKRVKF